MCKNLFAVLTMNARVWVKIEGRQPRSVQTSTTIQILDDVLGIVCPTDRDLYEVLWNQNVIRVSEPLSNLITTSEDNPLLLKYLLSSPLPSLGGWFTKNSE